MSLEFTASRKEFLEAVQKAARGLSGRSPLPILTHLKLEASGGLCEITGHDLEFGVTVKADVVTRTKGSVTVPGRLFESLLSAGTTEDVTVREQEGHRVLLEAGRSVYKLAGLPAEEFPALLCAPEVETFRIDAETLREAFAQVVPMVGTDETRPILTGVYLEPFEGNELLFVATDTHRLAVKTVKSTPVDRTAIVPTRAIQQMLHLLGQGEVRVFITENRLYAQFANRQDISLVTSLIVGQYPNWKRVIPAGFEGVVTCNTAALKAAVRRLALVLRVDGRTKILLKTTPSHLELSAQTKTDSAIEEIEATLEGATTTTACNASYFADALGVVDAERCSLFYNEPLKPLDLKPVMADGTEPDWHCILMPMQVEGGG